MGFTVAPVDPELLHGKPFVYVLTINVIEPEKERRTVYMLKNRKMLQNRKMLKNRKQISGSMIAISCFIKLFKFNERDIVNLHF